MAGQLLFEPMTLVHDRDHGPWVPQVFARRRKDRRWEVWVQFHPMNRRYPVLRTTVEASFEERGEAVTWAWSVDAGYLQDAFDRATEAYKAAAKGRPRPTLDVPWLLGPPHPHLR